MSLAASTSGAASLEDSRLRPQMLVQIWNHFRRAELARFAPRPNTYCSLFFSITAQNAPFIFLGGPFQ